MTTNSQNSHLDQPHSKQSGLNNRNGRNLLLSRPQAVAWIVVLISFVTFCAVCAAGTFGAYWFLFDSPTSVIASVTVSKGSVTVVMPDGTSTTDQRAAIMNALTPNVTLRTDGNSQGYVTFRDSYTDQPITTLFLLPNSSIKLIDATRPRFEWSKRNYSVLIGDATGQLAVDVFRGLSRPVTLTVQSQVGTVALGEVGSYMISAVDQYLRLYSQSGSGVIYRSPDLKWYVLSGRQGTMERDRPDATVEEYPFHVLNARLVGDDVESGRLPEGWGCTNVTIDQNEIDGSWEPKRIDLLSVVHIARGDATSALKSHSETGCEYYFQNDQRDLTQYKTLSIRVKMKIQGQSLNTCGTQGTECPVMLMLEYHTNNNPEIQQWHQGFFAKRPADDNSIRICETCPREHEQIGPNAWYIYDTGDLIVQFPENKKPASLIKVRIYASGHQFDAAIAELSVLGGR